LIQAENHHNRMELKRDIIQCNRDAKNTYKWRAKATQKDDTRIRAIENYIVNQEGNLNQTWSLYLEGIHLRKRNSGIS